MKTTKEHNQTADVEPESTRYTPGPWRYDAVLGTVGNGINICDIANLKTRHHAEADANARLIAAAPYLLEVLKDCITDKGAACERSHEYAMRRIGAINTRARAAIQKAEAGQ